MVLLIEEVLKKCGVHIITVKKLEPEHFIISVFEAMQECHRLEHLLWEARGALERASFCDKEIWKQQINRVEDRLNIAIQNRNCIMDLAAEYLQGTAFS